MRSVRVLGALLAIVCLHSPRGECAEAESFQLENGMRVLVVPVSGGDIFASVLMMKVGSRNDPAEYIGSSHMVEHLLIRGATEKFKEGESEMLLRAEGVELNGETLSDFSYVYAVGPVAKQDLVLQAQAEQWGRLKVTVDGILGEARRISQEKGFVESSPVATLMNAVVATAYRDAQPYRWGKVSLTMTDPNRFTVEQITRFYKEWYHPNSCYLVLMGDVQAARVRESVGTYFGAFPEAAIPSLELPHPTQKEERRVNLNAAGVGKRLLIAYHVPGIRNRDHACLSVLAGILSGRLYRSLATPGLASIAAAYTDYLAAGPGLFMINVTTGTSNISHIEKLVWGEIERLQRNGATELELFQAKMGFRPRLKFLTDPTFILTQGRGKGIPPSRLLAQAAINYGRTQLYFEPVREAYLKNIDSTEAPDIKRCAETYLVPTNRTVGTLELPQPVMDRPKNEE